VAEAPSDAAPLAPSERPICSQFPRPGRSPRAHGGGGPSASRLAPSVGCGLAVVASVSAVATVVSPVVAPVAASVYTVCDDCGASDGRYGPSSAPGC